MCNCVRLIFHVCMIHALFKLQSENAYAPNSDIISLKTSTTFDQ